MAVSHRTLPHVDRTEYCKWRESSLLLFLTLHRCKRNLKLQFLWFHSMFFRQMIHKSRRRKLWVLFQATGRMWTCYCCPFRFIWNRSSCWTISGKSTTFRGSQVDQIEGWWLQINCANSQNLLCSSLINLISVAWKKKNRLSWSPLPLITRHPAVMAQTQDLQKCKPCRPNEHTQFHELFWTHLSTLSAERRALHRLALILLGITLHWSSGCWVYLCVTSYLRMAPFKSD